MGRNGFSVSISMALVGIYATNASGRESARRFFSQFSSVSHMLCSNGVSERSLAGHDQDAPNASEEADAVRPYWRLGLMFAAAVAERLRRHHDHHRSNASRSLHFGTSIALTSS